MQPWYLQLETLLGPLAILGRSSLGTKDRWLVTMNIKGVVINELSSSTNLEIAVFFLLYDSDTRTFTAQRKIKGVRWIHTYKISFPSEAP